MDLSGPEWTKTKAGLLSFLKLGEDFMPTYDYFCSACGEKTEAFQKMSDPKLTTCPKCHKETLVRKPGGGVGLSFTGDGFYSTMYGDKKPPQESCGGGCACNPPKKD